MQDLPIIPRYLVTFTVGYDQKKNIDAAVKKVGILLLLVFFFFAKILLLLFANVNSCPYSILNLDLQFSENFTIVLFHYDGRASEWEEFEWSKRAIHIAVEKQTKWLLIICIIYFKFI